MATEVDFTSADIVEQFGDYYKDQGQSVSDINAALRHSFETQNAFTTIQTQDSVLDNVNTEFGEVVQSFQKQFTPKGSVTALPNRIQTYEMKIDQEFYPSDLRRSYFEFMSGYNMDFTAYPFVKWFVEVYLIAQIQHDLETQAIFNGVYVAPVTGTANATIATIDGIKKQINDKITAGTLTPIVTGALSEDPVTFCTQIETFIKSIDKLYWKKAMILNMSTTLALRYQEGRDLKYNTQYAQESSSLAVKYFPNITIQSYISHEGSDKIWCAPKQNSILAWKGFQNLSNFKIETAKRAVAVMADWRVGIGWLYDKALFTNDQDLAATGGGD